ncbi:putative serine protease HtrA [subsurface metagenome]
MKMKTKFVLVALVLLLGFAGGLSFAYSGPFAWLTNSADEHLAPPTTQTEYGEPLPDFGSVIETVARSVVRIESQIKKIMGYDGWTGEQIYRYQEVKGTGVIVDADGYIVTNKHVVEGAELDRIAIYLNDGSSVLHPTHLWLAPSTDLAVLKVAEGNLPLVTLANPGNVRCGDWVLAFGYPYGMRGDPSVTEGIVSALDRTVQFQDGTILEDMIQTTAAINPGNSGGPLVAMDGSVIGINTANIPSAENIGFAIGIKQVISLLESIP